MLKNGDDIVQFKWKEGAVVHKRGLRFKDYANFYCLYIHALGDIRGDFIVDEDGFLKIKWEDGEDDAFLNQSYVDKLENLKLIPILNDEFKDILEKIDDIVFLQNSKNELFREHLETLKSSLEILHNIASHS